MNINMNTVKNKAEDVSEIMNRAAAEYKKAQLLYFITTVGVGLVWLGVKKIEKIVIAIEEKHL